MSHANWLTIVGLGEEGVAGLSGEAQRALGKAAHVFGGQRHLALAAACVQGKAHPWCSPLRASLPALRACQGQPTVVLATGDPLHYGIATYLARHFDRAEMRVIPTLSSITHACHRMGWAQQTVEVLSLHGRDETQLNAHLHDGARLLILTSDECAPERIVKRLCTHGFERSHITLLEALNGERERIRTVMASQFAQLHQAGIDPLNILAVTLKASHPSTVSVLSPGRSSDAFLHDGQITRSEVRALTLARLVPRYGDCLWDIGAGSGAVSIEWLRMHESLTAIAVEQNPTRCHHIQDNAKRFGVPHLKVINGCAPEALAALEQHSAPDAIFIGGGGACPDTLSLCLTRLKAGGRLVMNAVTLETEQALAKAYKTHGGTLMRIGLEHAEPLGEMTGWRPARTIMQWCWIKPLEIAV